MELLISSINVVVWSSINLLLVYAAATFVGLKVMFPTLIKKESIIKILYVVAFGTLLCSVLVISTVTDMQVSGNVTEGVF